MKLHTRIAAAGACLLVSLSPVHADAEKKVRLLRTPSGVRFGLLGDKGKSPAPTLFVFAGGIEDSLKSADYNRIGRLLAKQGYLCVSLDLPCHGHDVNAKEPAGLDGWRQRIAQGEDMVAKFTGRATAVLDHLIKEGYTHPHRVAVCGTSRGGFLALHFSVADPRVRCVAAFAPVTDLLVLREFAKADKPKRARTLALIRHADKLAGRAVWLCIGNHDERVGTDEAIALTRKVVKAAVAQKKPALVELHVMPTVGHRIHGTAHGEAAAWVAARLKESK